MYISCGSQTTHLNFLLYLCYLDSRGRSRETRLAGLELSDWAEVSLAKDIDACDPEPVGLTWTELLLLSALVVLRPWQLPLVEKKARADG